LLPAAAIDLGCGMLLQQMLSFSALWLLEPYNLPVIFFFNSNGFSSNGSLCWEKVQSRIRGSEKPET
jgi:hypothetical protein